MADDEDEEEPSFLQLPRQNPFHDHRPWRETPDPDDGDIGQIRWTQTGPGNFSVTGTIYRTYSPSPRRGNEAGNDTHDPQHPIINSFATMLQSIVGNNLGAGLGSGQRQSQGEQTQTQGGQQSPGTSPNSAQTQGGPRIQDIPGGHRFTYHQTARLVPRDANHPHAHLEPVDDLNNVLASLFGALGDHPGQRTPGTQPGQPGQPPQMNPLAALFAAVLNPDLAHHGDFVYTQEALDRIISQLMEQNATGNAPGPATAEAIAALPKKKVSVEMLGPDGRAECSICMDEVNVGDEVTELPCHHWFHQQCVGMWLGEHDTCPHCRKGIMDRSKHDENTTSTLQGAASDSSGPSNRSVPSPNPTPQIPGSFGTVESGTAEDHFLVPETREQQREHEQQAEQPSPNDQQSSSPATTEASGGSISERIRRGLFGAPR